MRFGMVRHPPAMRQARGPEVREAPSRRSIAALARAAGLVLAALAVGRGARRGAPGDSVARAAQARAFFEHADKALAQTSIDQRRVAILDLEQASLLEPREPLYDLVLARTYYAAGFLKLARQRYEKVAQL